MDETSHEYGTKGDNGGTQSLSYTNDELPHAGHRVGKSSGGHTTGAYGSNPLEPMPPIFIFSSNVKKDEEKMKVKVEWVKGLPEVTGYWGFSSPETVPSFVAVRPKGSTDAELFEDMVEKYSSLYPNLAPKCKCDNDGKLIKGPIFIKSDMGPGRQVKTFENVAFRRKAELRGIHLAPGVLNTTQVTQEMDDFFELFKAKTDAKTQDIFGRKTLERANEFCARREAARLREEAVARGGEETFVLFDHVAVYFHFLLPYCMLLYF